MPGTAIPAAVVTELQRQMNHEYGAAHAYTALAMWCAGQNLKGFARFFHKQSGEEREHAQRFADHLLDRGVAPELAALPAPTLAFESLLAVASARKMEQANTKGIHKAYQAAVKTGDVAAQVTLQWFVSEQVEEEAWCEEMVAAGVTPGSACIMQSASGRTIATAAGPGRDTSSGRRSRMDPSRATRAQSVGPDGAVRSGTGLRRSDFVLVCP